MAGSTLWCKFFFDFAISRHAHLQAKARPKARPQGSAGK